MMSQDYDVDIVMAERALAVLRRVCISLPLSFFLVVLSDVVLLERKVALGRKKVELGGSRIEDDGDRDDSSCWNVVSPELENCAQGRDLEGNQKRFI